MLDIEGVFEGSALASARAVSHADEQRLMLACFQALDNFREFLGGLTRMGRGAH